MTRERGPHGPTASFSGGADGRTDREPQPSDGCTYVTPDGRCGDPGAIHELAGVRVELCSAHLEAALEENGLDRRAAS